MSVEAERFWSYVVKGPAENDCWIWTGAIADDGYGRFWTSTPDGQKVIRPHRYAVEQVTGENLTPSTITRHACDLPICVHADLNEMATHLTVGDLDANSLDRMIRNRVRNGHDTLTGTGMARKARAERMRALRDHIRAHGYDADAVRTAIAGAALDQATLF